MAEAKGWLSEFLDKFGKVYKYIRPHKTKWLVLFLLANFYLVLSLVSPMVTKFLIDDVLSTGNIELLNLLMIALIVAALLEAVTGIYSTYVGNWLGHKLIFDIRNDLFEHMEHLSLKFYSEKNFGDILSRMFDDLIGLMSFIVTLYSGVILNILNITLILAVALYLNWKVTLVSLIVIPAFIFIQKRYAKKIREQYSVIRISTADFWNFMQERLKGMMLVKLFTKEEDELSTLKEKGSEWMDKNVSLTMTEAKADALTGFVSFLVLAGILWYGGYEVIAGTITVGSLIAIYLYIARLFDPVSSLVGVNLELQKTFVSIDRINEYLEQKPEVEEKPDSIEMPEIRGEIEFRNVSFAYEKKRPVLEKASFKINAGEKIGIVGPSGAGKTTAWQLLYRLYDPDEGSILIDGIDLKNVKLKSLRKQLAIVNQEPVLFYASIKENIKYGNKFASDEKITEAARLANIHEFIEKLPNKYDTAVGPEGTALSSGEKQRIAIARALLKQPKIFVFDEITAFLDADSEQKISEAIDNIAKGKTSIIIAHRLSTLKKVGRIIVISEHGAMEHGTFDELMRKKGLFHKYYTEQMKEKK